MRFRCVESTADGRLTKGKIYVGSIVASHVGMVLGVTLGLRIVVFDDRGEWMTFNPKVFRPYPITGDEP